MLFVLSPAKSLNFEDAPPAALTTPQLLGDIAELAKTTRRLTKPELKRLMHISDNLAALNRARFQAFDPACEDGVQAAFAFAGDVYQGLQARTLDKKGLAYAQDHIRILSGLYGVLRPLDAIQPYRLEMGVRLKTRRGTDLYGFWREKVTALLADELESHKDPTLINIASQEYFGSVDAEALGRPIVTCHFREVKDGESKIVAFYAKKARGLMARFAADNGVAKAEDLKGFNQAGYSFQSTQSSDTDWVFTRPSVTP